MARGIELQLASQSFARNEGGVFTGLHVVEFAAISVVVRKLPTSSPAGQPFSSPAMFLRQRFDHSDGHNHRASLSPDPTRLKRRRGALFDQFRAALR